MIYDQDGAAKEVRPNLFLSMGLWHIFKHAQLALWKMASRSFFGPLFHHLFPGESFNQKPRHKFLTWILSALRLSYGKMRPFFVDAYAHRAYDIAAGAT